MSCWPLVRGTALAACFAALPLSAARSQSAQEIVDRVDQLLRGRSSRGSVTMEVVTEHWSRTLEMDIWSV